MRLPTGPDMTSTALYNPTKEDFECKRMSEEDNTQHSYTLPSRQIRTYPKYLADHIGNKLAQKIALEDDSGLTYEIRFNAAHDKIFIKL